MTLRWRVILVGLLIGVLGFLSVSNLVSEERRAESALLPDGGLRLGLDLQGGIHWVLGVKLDEAVDQELRAQARGLEQIAEEDGFLVDRAEVDAGQLLVTVASTADATAVREWAADRDSLLTMVSDDGIDFLFELTSEGSEGVRQQGMAQVLEVLRRRIADPIQGIPESVVTRQGTDRILVQIPGGQIDRSTARGLLQVTGLLEFKLVVDSDQNEELLRARYAEGLPENTELGFEVDRESGRRTAAYLLESTPAITGEHLEDARWRPDRLQRPIVTFEWDREGADIFRAFTEAHIGEPMAVVLDDRVYTAPVIRGRIGASGQIEGRFTAQEAADLAVVLRAGSLPIPVEIEEERTVGPALGADSISRGVRASILALVLIVAFVGGYYRLSGGYASFALLANLLLLTGLMSIPPFATLTLPGIAGIVLTVGMAVDANVIIFERIREELRSGKTPRGAIATGFSKALWTILDANITTMITAIVLYEFGTGPIKGFAVTLMFGIVTSVFSALVITRLLFEIHPGNKHVESLSI